MGGAVALDAGAAGAGGGYSSSSYESSSYSSGGFGGAGFAAGGGADAAFAAADTNQDGTLDQGEFGNFVGTYFSSLRNSSLRRTMTIS